MRLNNSRTVDFNGLSLIPTPHATDTWQPMPHSRVMQTVIEHADARNLAIDEIHYSLVDVKSDGVVQPYPDMFATMYMESDNGVYRNMLGIRNSHNKRFGASACSGSSVMVCSNGCFSGDHIISSKHTKNVHESFNNRVSDMLDSVIDTWIKNEHRYNGYRATDLSDSDFAELLGNAIIHNAINPSKALKVYQEYVEPRHDAFLIAMPGLHSMHLLRSTKNHQYKSLTQPSVVLHYTMYSIASAQMLLNTKLQAMFQK